MKTRFPLADPATARAVDNKATWTREDRDYIWLQRGLRFLRFAAFPLPGVATLYCYFMFETATGLVRFAYLLGCAVIIIGFANIVVNADSRACQWLARRFHHDRERQLYESRAWPPYIEDAINALETIDQTRSQLLHSRKAILEPLRRTVLSYRRLLQRITLTSWTLAAIGVIYAASGHARGSQQTVPAITIATGLILIGIAMPRLWQILIYDIPARYNPMFSVVELSPAMAAVLQDACEDDGQIWLVDNKVVLRSLFKTPFGPLLLGDPWNEALLPFGLWSQETHIRKEMSPEIRKYYEMTRFLINAAHAFEDEHEDDD